MLDENRDVAERLSGKEMANLNNYYLITFPSEGPEVIELANSLLGLGIVELVYFPATASSLIVVAAAGNGSVDLDHPVYGGWY